MNYRNKKRGHRRQAHVDTATILRRPMESGRGLPQSKALARETRLAWIPTGCGLRQSAAALAYRSAMAAGSRCTQQQLRVWNDGVDFYALTGRVFRGCPDELKRVALQEITSVDLVHRNVAEGYCRRSIREYLHSLNIALGSLGESVSGLVAYHKAEQIAESQFGAHHSRTPSLP
jgi:four helix bundle protein